MARVQAADYGEKRQAIIDSSARLFAESGYPAVRIAEIAKACGVSKAMVYHYFPAKDDILHHLVREHLEQVVESLAGEIDADAEVERARLESFVRGFLEASAKARHRNLVAIHDVIYLSPERRTEMQALQRQVMERLGERLAAANPGAPREMLRPMALYLMGVLNWSDRWFRPDGPIGAGQMAAQVNQAFLHGWLSFKG
ncbi:TetR/AcrR family transcriptional regulator [uncultured Albimonas sp.]|uniref:TetR/AcrR family transcriptional regulator n=1 Tax=uncultured Albimonas sp. TaxID=1331701 RepID=UPI0030ED13A4|tara:strand:+ start:4739 stop:5335 length:597 start_codon:yes stop_codon:yes gene_type:complete